WRRAPPARARRDRAPPRHGAARAEDVLGGGRNVCGCEPRARRRRAPRAERTVTTASPAPLLELATAYQRSHVLATMLELRVPSRLASGARSPAELAAELGADPLAMGRLLDAAVALELLARDGDRVGNTTVSATYLVCGRDGYLGDAL